jgi:hypothetical protein
VNHRQGCGDGAGEGGCACGDGCVGCDGGDGGDGDEGAGGGSTGAA